MDALHGCQHFSNMQYSPKVPLQHRKIRIINNQLSCGQKGVRFKAFRNLQKCGANYLAPADQSTYLEKKYSQCEILLYEVEVKTNPK